MMDELFQKIRSPNMFLLTFTSHLYGSSDKVNVHRPENYIICWNLSECERTSGVVIPSFNVTHIWKFSII